MAYDKVIDSAKLDADLTTVADAIRAKSGASAALAFPEGFVASVSKIPIGSGTELPELKDPGTAEDLVWGKEMIDGDGNVVTGKFDLLSPGFAENSFLYAQNVGVREADDGSKRIYFKRTIDSRIGYEAESPIQMEVIARLFGDAKPEDVIDGATFTSKEGLAVPGTIPFLPAGQRGSIGLADEAYRTEHATFPAVRAIVPIRARLAMDAESSAQIDIPFGVLPDAEANLLAENIKKGVSIFDVVGTYEGSDGGGGDGVFVEQATPTIRVDYNGKITATAIQEAGQVEAGVKTATYQMSTLGYTEYTPGVDDQNIPILKYIVGNQIIKGDANLVTENIKKGVSIFGVVGSYEGGGNFGGGDNFFVTEATLASSYGTKTGKVLCTIPYIGEHINDPGLFVMLMRKDTSELVLSVPIVMACNSAYLNSSYSIAVQRTQYGVSVAYKPNKANGYQLNNSSAKDMPRVYADASGNVYILPYGSYTFEGGTYSVIYGIL